MREIKIKVWDTVRQCMYKPQGITFDINNLAPFAVKVSGRSWEPVGKFELLQWTGLCDSSGNEIYEGDLLIVSSKIYEAIWDSESAGFKFIEPDGLSACTIEDALSGKVIGNRFQNSDIYINTGSKVI